MRPRGLIVSAPSSGAGKTTVTLGLLAALRARGVEVASGKTGPDYIDPAFHAMATGRPCVTLDPWCADAAQLRARAMAADAPLVVVEGAMGLFDGAPAPDAPLGRGSTADVAEALGLPVVLIVDGARRAQTAAAVVAGMAGFREDVRVAGVILNRAGSARHAAMLRRAVETVAPVLGVLPRAPDLAVPSRHLGLVQAAELPDVEGMLTALREVVEAHCDLDALQALAAPVAAGGTPRRLPPPGQRVAVAADEAFGFAYAHALADWRAQGAEVATFSPLADEGPGAEADAVILPGGYPELHAGRIAGAASFRAAMEAARVRGAAIHGECGGYMVLGDGLLDAWSRRHAMLGFLRLETSFAERRLTLGYRRLEPAPGVALPASLGHEFHYSTCTKAEGEPLWRAFDAEGRNLGPSGLRAGRVTGAYPHLVEVAPQPANGSGVPAR